MPEAFRGSRNDPRLLEALPCYLYVHQPHLKVLISLICLQQRSMAMAAYQQVHSSASQGHLIDEVSSFQCLLLKVWI
jgi:hypothetical protein